MKALFIGIFAIIAIGVIFFAMQFIKRPDFASLPEPEKTAATQKTFVDAKSGLTMDYPDYWQLIPSMPNSDYAPVFMAGDQGFFAMYRKSIKRFQSPAEDLEFYSEDTGFKNFFSQLAMSQNGTPVMQAAGQHADGGYMAPESIPDQNITLSKAKSLTYRSGIPGFTMEYMADINGAKVQGTIYFMYGTGGDLIRVMTVYLKSDPVLYSKFKVETDNAMSSLVTL